MAEENKQKILRLALCDDTEAERRKVRRRFAAYGKEHGIFFDMAEFSGGTELLSAFQNQYDLLILDIEMKGMDGLEVARKIREIDDSIPLLFLTNYQNYAYGSFSVNPISYIMKNEEDELFYEKLDKVFRDIALQQKSIYITSGDKTYSFEWRSIISMEYHDHKIDIFFIQGDKKEIRMGISEMEKCLAGVEYLFVNRNTIVNFMWVQDCSRGIVTMKHHQKEYEIPRRKRSQVEKLFCDYCQRQMY